MNNMQHIKRGDTVVFGTHSKTGKAEEWVVLMTNSSEKTALIASTESVARIPYFNPNVNDTSKPASWKNSFLRKWLQQYCSHFNWQEEEAIHYVTMPEYEDDKETVLDRVFVLSEGEVSLYFKNDEERVLLCNHEYNLYPEEGWRNSCSWWLRDPAVLDSESSTITQAPICSENGALGDMQDVEYPSGVRACMWVDTSALKKVLNPDLEPLNICLMEVSKDQIVVFRDGQEQAMDVLAEFVDYDLKQTFAVLEDKSIGRPIIARTSVDFFIKSKLEDKYEPLINTLKYKPYHKVADKLQHKQDEKKVIAWMSQEAWAPTPGCWQPAIIDDGSCFIQMGRDSWNQNRDDERLYWKVIKRRSNKVLCICESGIVLDEFMPDCFEDGLEEEVSWGLSKIRTYLNDDFLDCFFADEEEQRILYCRTVEETDSAPALYDKVFLLSDAEVGIFMPTEQERIIKGTPSHETIGCGYPLPQDEDCKNWWWLRTLGRKPECVCCVSPAGLIDRNGKWGRKGQYAIRPAILVELTNVEIPFIRKE